MRGAGGTRGDFVGDIWDEAKGGPDFLPLLTFHP